MELNPVTRKETFLAAAAGQDVTTPTPITREEVFLDAIAKSGGGGGGSSGGGVLVVHYENGALDKTWQEIHDAVASGQFIVIQNENDDGIFWNYISSVESDSNYYMVMVLWSGTETVGELGTNSPTGYPAG